MYICTYLKTCHVVCQVISYVKKIDIPKSQPCFTTGPCSVSTRMEKFVVIDLDDATLVTSNVFGTSAWLGEAAVWLRRHDVDVVFKGFLRIVNQLQPFNRDLLFCISLSFQIYPISVPNHTGMNQSLMFIQDYL